MKELLTNIIHGAISIFLIAAPIVIQQHASWENITLGGLLVAAQSYFNRYQAVKAAGLRV